MHAWSYFQRGIHSSGLHQPSSRARKTLALEALKAYLFLSIQFLSNFVHLRQSPRLLPSSTSSPSVRVCATSDSRIEYSQQHHMAQQYSGSQLGFNAVFRIELSQYATTTIHLFSTISHPLPPSSNPAKHISRLRSKASARLSYCKSSGIKTSRSIALPFAMSPLSSIVYDIYILLSGLANLPNRTAYPLLFLHCKADTGSH